MVDRPYHDYATSMLRELSRDLASCQAQLDDQRADYLELAGSDRDELRRLDVLIDEVDNKLAAVDRELGIRHRERRRSVSRSKPHCRAKRTPVA